ncbi:jg4212 [Pararge aegeria aegeria]|uniref:Jg4212 protein n=1 Tax=Pararge aegeria aegeria TaxID=348720 RepID=A0A8S4R829_9NEOP|nr:jg4212 [Pararge aegeria aegeria]
MEKSARPRTALNECVKVVVRCRPLSDKEKHEGFDEVKKREKYRPEQKWYERLSSKSSADSKTANSPLQVVKVWAERGAVQVYNPKGQDKLFTYDAAYDCTADTQTIYDEMVRPLVASVLDGFNGCVFAYGQTGTGKTHTMEGTADHEGIIPRAFRHIWAHIENTASPDVTHLVSCSYVELYLEDVRDLLSKDPKKLTIRGQVSAVLPSGTGICMHRPWLCSEPCGFQLSRQDAIFGNLNMHLLILVRSGRLQWPVATPYRQRFPVKRSDVMPRSTR